MYWSYRHFKIITLVAFTVLTACSDGGSNRSSSTSDGSGAPLATPLPKQKCIEGEKAIADCVVMEASTYSYEKEFNGRIEMGDNIEGLPGERQLTIPKGYYKNKLATVSDFDNVAANIIKGKAIFGISGDLDSAAIADCQSSLTNSTDPNPSTCRLKTVNGYVYQKPYGGRSQLCSITNSEISGLSFQGRCWFDNSENYFIYNQRVQFPSCPANGQALASCKATADSHLYSEAYGGRAEVCPLNTIVGYKCFVKDPNLAVFSITSCKENPEVDAALNNRACFPTKLGNWVYDAPYGGRDKNCEDNNNGNCFFHFSTKAQSSTNLLTENVKAGETIFGVMGSFITEGFYWGSGAHRDPGDKRMVYQKPPGPTPTATPITLPYIEAEANFDAKATSVPNNYRFVPKISTDSEAVGSDQKVVRKKDGTDWGTTECGFDLSKETDPKKPVLEKRISNCKSVFGESATWDGVIRGNAGQGVWSLVARKITDDNPYEVWLDTSTDLLWSSKVSPAGGLNWCKAAGNSNSSKIDEKMRENDPSGICNSNQHQNNGADHPISACIEGISGYLDSVPANERSSMNGFLSTGTDQRGKAGLKTLPPAQRAQGRVFWRIPTMYDFILANHNGLRNVLPDVGGGEEWTGTTYSNDPSSAWTYNTSNMVRRVQPKTFGYAVRCVGR